MESFQEVDRIDDLSLFKLFNTWSDGKDAWRTAEDGWIYLNLHLGNVARITHNLAAVDVRQGHKFFKETAFGNIIRREPDKK